MNRNVVFCLLAFSTGRCERRDDFVIYLQGRVELWTVGRLGREAVPKGDDGSYEFMATYEATISYR